MSISRVSIQLAITHGAPTETNPAYCSPPPLEEEVRDLLLKIDTGGHDANMEWEYLKKIYGGLQNTKQTPRVRNLREMIEPVLAKYGHHKVV